MSNLNFILETRKNAEQDWICLTETSLTLPFWNAIGLALVTLCSLNMHENLVIWISCYTWSQEVLWLLLLLIRYWCPYCSLEPDWIRCPWPQEQKRSRYDFTYCAAVPLPGLCLVLWPRCCICCCDVLSWLLNSISKFYVCSEHLPAFLSAKCEIMFSFLLVEKILGETLTRWNVDYNFIMKYLFHVPAYS